MNITEKFTPRYIMLIGIMLLLTFFASGCDVAYFFDFALGQTQLLIDSVPIEEALKDDRLTLQQKNRLHLVAKIKNFGETELGLTKTQNYRKIYLKSNRPPVYVVSAAPKGRLNSMTWWFPVVEKTPYLVFFDLNKAKAKIEKISQKNLDASLIPGDAFSTVGWFNDPVTLNLIEGSTVGLVETLLHEMTHATIFVKRQMEFNEGVANYVGKVGAFLFFRSAYGSSHHFTIDAQNAIEDQRLFSSFFSSLLDWLDGFYNSPIGYQEKLSKREEILSGALELFEWHKERLKTDRFRYFGKTGLNNSYLLSTALYHQHFDLFEMVFNENGKSVREMLEFFQDLAHNEGDILLMTREWVNGFGRTSKRQDSDYLPNG